MSNKSFREHDWDIVENSPTHVGDNPIEQLMAAMNQPLPDPYSEPARMAVGEAIVMLDEKDRWVVEAVYTWGHSYAEIADMMGYASKASAHAVVKTALNNLRNRLIVDHRIIRLLEGKVTGISQETWQDASWKAVRDIGKCADVGEFMPEVFDTLFHNISLLVREHTEQGLVDYIWAVGTEAGRGLVELGKWDMEHTQDTLCRKQHDYGHGNINAFGLTGLAVRICDKIARYSNLQGRDNAVHGEALEDTLLDMVGYAVLAKMVSNGTFQLELEPPF